MTLLGTTPNFGFGLINYRTNPWHEDEYNNWRSLDTILATIVELSAVQGVWQNSTAYSVGQKLVDGTTGTLYEVMVSHTSAASPTSFAQDRINHPTFWQAVGGGSASFGEYSVKNFGATGNGTTDDTAAFQQALSELRAVFVPEGTYKLTAPLVLTENQFLFGNGAASVLQFRTGALDKNGAASYNAAYNGLVLNGSYITVADLTIVGSNKAVLLKHTTSPVVANTVRGLDIWDAVTGIELDGGTDTNYPAYWNEFNAIRILRPRDVGVKLHVSGAGDSPNANKFRHVRVYSLGAAMVNDKYGFWIKDGKYGNALVDCEANIHSSGNACLMLGDGSGGNWITNFVAESNGPANGIQMTGLAGTDVGAGANIITNYFHTTAGSSIYNPAGTGVYYTLFGGFPDRARLPRTRITELVVENFLLESVFTDTSGTVALPTGAAVHLLSSFGGALNFDLPAPGDAAGKMLFIAKIDNSENHVTIRRDDDANSGPGNTNYILSKENDYIITFSNGAEWFIYGTNYVKERSDFFETTITGTTINNLDPNVQLNIVNANAGATTINMPSPGGQSAGKRVTIVKNDLTGNAITITGLAAGATHKLSTQYDFVTLTSNGAAWFIVASANPSLRFSFHDASVSGNTYNLDPFFEVHLVSPAAGTCTVNLPAASAAAGRRVIIKRGSGGGGGVTISPNVEGLTQTLNSTFATIQLFSNGSTWYVLGTFTY